MGFPCWFKDGTYRGISDPLILRLVSSKRELKGSVALETLNALMLLLVGISGILEAAWGV